MQERCDSCTNFVVAKSSSKCLATKRVYTVRQSTSCVSKTAIFIAFCSDCLKQGVRVTVDGKPRLPNYKFHINKKVQPCSIVSYCIDVCSDTDDPSRNFRFIVIDQY